MKKFLILFLTVCCFAVSSLFAANANEIFKKSFEQLETLKKQGISYDVKSVIEDEKKKSINATVYMKGKKIRIDATEGVVIIDEKNMYIFSVAEKTAIKMNINADMIKQTTFDISQEKADELLFVKKSSKNGYSCYMFKSKDNGEDVKYYLTDKYGLPTYVKEENLETNITNFKVGDIKDDLFVLPKDVNVIDMTDFSPEQFLQNMK